MTDAPTNIRALQAERVLELTWPGGRADRLGYAYLRGECPCASCRHEWTGERLIRPDDIPADIRLEGLEGIGNYAVRLQWSDGHGSGIYTWESLANLAAGAP
jgi:DUF971 family protein